MTQAKQIICMKWGTLFGADYVNKLYAMARRNCTGELRFVCLTDDRNGIRSEVECHGCPDVKVEFRTNPGWRKLITYADSSDLFGLSGDWLFLDLDVVITGNIDVFFDYKPDQSFVVMQNWTQKGKGIGNTSVYRFRVGAERYLLDNFESNYANYYQKYRIEQSYVSCEVKQLHFWPDEWCLLFKVQCVPVWPLRFWKEAYLPENARIIAFPGDPNPHDAAIGRWPVKKAYKRLYKSIKPVQWVKKLWSES
ncbi:MAG: hypothetical protein ACWA5R_02355 [bacterium]